MSDTPPDRALDRIRSKYLLDSALTKFEGHSWSSTPGELNQSAEEARVALENLLDAISQQVAIAKRDAGLDASGKIRGG